MRGPKPRPTPAKTATPPPASPADMNPAAKVVWDQITALLAKRKVLTEEDNAALVVLATSIAQYNHAQAEIDATGTVVASSAGVPVKNPYCTVQSNAFDRIRPLLAEFGLTPSARARLKLTDEPSTDGDEFGL